MVARSQEQPSLFQVKMLSLCNYGMGPYPTLMDSCRPTKFWIGAKLLQIRFGSFGSKSFFATREERRRLEDRLEDKKAPPPPPPPPLAPLLRKKQEAEMEIEVKLRLPNSSSHQELSDLLSPFHIKTHLQENIFFDGSSKELSSKLAVLRIRFYNSDSRCVISLKAKAILVNGISHVEEDEEDIDSSIGRACVAEPWRLFSIDSSRILKRVRDEFSVGGFVCLGGFRNVRNVYDWKGLILELDETQFDFGTCYEIECESTEPEQVKTLLEDFLKENGVDYSYSTVSKFGIFRSGKLPE